MSSSLACCDTTITDKQNNLTVCGYSHSSSVRIAFIYIQSPALIIGVVVAGRVFLMVYTAFAIIRRLLKGQSPFTADRGHVHHRLVDLGFDQKQTVAILYALSAVLGLSAVVLTSSGEAKILILVLAVALAVFFGISVFAYDLKKEKEQVKKDEDNKKD